VLHACLVSTQNHLYGSVVLCQLVILWISQYLRSEGYVPPGSRKEKLRDVPQRHLKGIRCEEIRINSDSQVKLSGIIVSRDTPAPPSEKSPEMVLFYLQGMFVILFVITAIMSQNLLGNAGNPLHRLPIFQTLLHQPHDLSIIAIAPRSFWTSSKRTPTQRGILSDYTHSLEYVQTRFPDSRIVLYGHSLGGSVAVCLLAQLSDDQGGNIKGLVLENPFTSIPDMVRTLYPQKWVPYRYLAPFAWDKWNAVLAMRESQMNGSVLGRVSKDTMVIVSEKDEVVPGEMGKMIMDQRGVGKHPGIGRLVNISGALHEDAWQKRQWASEMRSYLDVLRTR
jgi:uncharacterized protein